MSENTRADAYQRMYHILFHAATAAQQELVESSMRAQQISLRLQQAQAECEDLLLRMTDDEESPEH